MATVVLTRSAQTHILDGADPIVIPGGIAALRAPAAEFLPEAAPEPDSSPEAK